MQSNPQGWEKNWDKTVQNINGTVSGKSIEATFTLENDNLKIVGQKTSCGCTVSRVDGNKIVAKLKVPKYNKKETTVNKSISVTLEDKVTKIKQKNILRFSGTVYKNESDIPS
jgi:hypothetical protein